MKNRIIISLIALTLLGCANEFYYSKGKKVELTPIKSTQQSKQITSETIKYYHTPTGQTVGVNNQILVECHKDSNCTQLLQRYTLTEIQPLTESIFLITVPPTKNIFELSQKLYQETNITNAHPNFIKIHTRR